MTTTRSMKSDPKNWMPDFLEGKIRLNILKLRVMDINKIPLSLISEIKEDLKKFKEISPTPI